MRHRPAVVIERIAGPYTAVAVVESVIVGVEITFFPLQVADQDRPHLVHVCRIRIILEVPEQLVDEIEVHVIMMHNVITVRTSADIAVAVHLRAPRLGRPCQALLRILCRMRQDRRHIGDLALRISREVGARPLRQSEHIGQIARPPSVERHAPCDGPVQPHLAVPSPVGSRHERRPERVDIRVGRIEHDLRGEPPVVVHCLIEERLGRSTHRSGESILAVGADSHHRIGECVARFPFSRHFVGFLRVRVKAVSRVSIQVTPSAEGFRLHPTNNTLQHGVGRQSVGLELPHRRVLVGRRQYGDIDRALAEGRVCKPIRPSAGIIPCLTAYRLF